MISFLYSQPTCGSPGFQRRWEVGLLSGGWVPRRERKGREDGHWVHQKSWPYLPRESCFLYHHLTAAHVCTLTPNAALLNCIYHEVVNSFPLVSEIITVSQLPSPWDGVTPQRWLKSSGSKETWCSDWSQKLVPGEWTLAGVQPRWIQGIRSRDGVGEDQETTA